MLRESNAEGHSLLGDHLIHPRFCIVYNIELVELPKCIDNVTVSIVCVVHMGKHIELIKFTISLKNRYCCLDFWGHQSPCDKSKRLPPPHCRTIRN
jgi:hypothetical protein